MTINNLPKITGYWIYCTDRMPQPGREYACAIQTDYGPEIHTCFLTNRTGKLVWEHDNEPTFCKGYLFHPYAWADELTMPPVPNEGDEE